MILPARGWEEKKDDTDVRLVVKSCTQKKKGVVVYEQR